MRLSEFIVCCPEPILAEFEQFARSHTTAGSDMDMRALRDHAAAILTAIALDLEQPQSAEEQTLKSKGDALDAGPGLTAAEQHGTDRADSGFSLDEMFSEYRALRASVLRLWTAERGRLDGTDIQDLIRFNEAIDQALAESVRKYATSIDHSRDLFLAVLGHDLRTPLSAVVTGAGFLESNSAEASQKRMASMIRSSGERMTRLVGDLLDFTLSRLGRGIPIERKDVDIAECVRAAVQELEAARPDRDIRFVGSGDLRGQWDGDRIRQALGNLLVNAVQHGSPASPILVRASGGDDAVTIEVHNTGAAIPPESRKHIFDPFKRLDADATQGSDRRSMGLGLYITQQIVGAHGGTIDVESSSAGDTRFVLRLPRQP